MSAQFITLIALVVLAGLGVASAFISAWLKGNHIHSKQFWGDWFHGVSTEMAGAIITALLLGLIVGAFQDSESERNLKSQLIRQMGSTVNGEATRAVEELRAHGWLRDGTLQRVFLAGADLQEVDLSGANLQGVDLSGANLQGANLFRANLQEVDLGGANLQGADLVETRLQGADMLSANLQGADLGNANLQGANLVIANLQGVFLTGTNLEGANLRGANLEGAMPDVTYRGSSSYQVRYYTKFDENTVLPDGTSWISNTNMTRFTDPNHPDFWRSDTLNSPAYQGDAENDIE